MFFSDFFYALYVESGSGLQPFLKSRLLVLPLEVMLPCDSFARDYTCLVTLLALNQIGTEKGDPSSNHRPVN